MTRFSFQTNDSQTDSAQSAGRAVPSQSRSTIQVGGIFVVGIVSLILGLLVLLLGESNLGG